MSHCPFLPGEGVGAGADFGPQMFRVLPLPMWHFEQMLDCALLCGSQPGTQPAFWLPQSRFKSPRRLREC